MKTGSIYTDMIKPLEKRYYDLLSKEENIRRKKLDEQNPYFRNVYYEDRKLHEFKELRSLVKLVAEVCVHVCVSKDIQIGRACMKVWSIEPPKDAALGFDMLDRCFRFYPHSAFLNRGDREEILSDWPLVIRGEMTPEDFVEHLKTLPQDEFNEVLPTETIDKIEQLFKFGVAQEQRKAPKERFKEMDNSVLSAVNRETKRLVSLINWSVIKAAVGRDCVFEELVPREEDRSLIDHAVYMLSNRSGSTLRFFSQSKEMMVEQVQTFVIDFIKNVATGAAMLDPDWEYHDGASQKKYIIQRLKMTPSVEIEPGHIFEIEPYNRSKHGDEIDMLMDDKGTTQRFKIGEDGQPIFPKSDVMGPETARELAKLLETHPICKSGAASVSVSKDGRSIKLTSTAIGQVDWSSLALRPKPPVKELSPWQKKINERIEAFLQKESQYYER